MIGHLWLIHQRWLLEWLLEWLLITIIPTVIRMTYSPTPSLGNHCYPQATTPHHTLVEHDLRQPPLAIIHHSEQSGNQPATTNHCPPVVECSNEIPPSIGPDMGIFSIAMFDHWRISLSHYSDHWPSSNHHSTVWTIKQPSLNSINHGYSSTTNNELNHCWIIK